MKPAQTQPDAYEIRVAGHLSPQWADWFEGLTIILVEDGDTILTGPVIDQAALYGLLKKVRDLGLALVAVNAIEPEPPAILGADQAVQPSAEDLGDNSDQINIISIQENL